MRFLRFLFRSISHLFRSLGYSIVLALLTLVQWILSAIGKAADFVFTHIIGQTTPVPEDMPNEEFLRRVNFNIEHIICELWVSDRKLDRLIGMSPIDDNAKLCRELSHNELIYCAKRLDRCVKAFPTFQSEYLNAAKKTMNICIESMSARITGKEKPRLLYNDKAFSAGYIRRLWKKALRQTKAGPLPESDPALREQIVSQLTLIKPLFSTLF